MAVGNAKNTTGKEKRLTESEWENFFEIELHSLRPEFLLNWPNVDALLTNGTLTVDTNWSACGRLFAMTKVSISTSLVPDSATLIHFGDVEVNEMTDSLIVVPMLA